jgi:hypothetical protein
MRGFDSFASIPHLHKNGCVFLSQRQTDYSAVCSVPQRVGDQVVHDPFQGPFIAERVQLLRRNIEGYLEPAAFDLLMELKNALPAGFAYVDTAQRDIRVPGFELRQVEERIDQADGFSRLAEQLGQQVVSLGFLDMRSQMQRLRVAENDRQRRPEIVRDVREHSAGGDPGPLVLGRRSQMAVEQLIDLGHERLKLGISGHVKKLLSRASPPNLLQLAANLPQLRGSPGIRSDTSDEEAGENNDNAKKEDVHFIRPPTCSRFPIRS